MIQDKVFLIEGSAIGVPEPSTIWLAVVGLAALATLGYRGRKRAAAPVGCRVVTGKK